MDSLLDVLSYKREVLTQLLLVATIFGGFAMSGVVALLVGPNRDRLHRTLLAILCLASLSFIFAAALDAVFLPASGRRANVRLSPEAIGTLLAIGDSIVWAVIFGAGALMVSVSLFGFVFSKKLGYLTVVAGAVATVLLFLEFRRISLTLM